MQMGRHSSPTLYSATHVCLPLPPLDDLPFDLPWPLLPLPFGSPAGRHVVVGVGGLVTLGLG